MPTVLRIDGWRIVIYPNDHRPPHVHVLAAGNWAVYILHCPAGPTTLRGSRGFSTPDLNRIETAISARVPELCEDWRRINGD